jgi:5-methylcytosine-specific restriction endonuclease McrA
MTPEQPEAELTQHHGWDARTLKVWVRAQGRCEYCDADLLGSASVYFHGAHIDHIVPGTGNDLDNLALSCVACNRIKRRKMFVAAGEVPPERKTLIERAQRYIGERRVRDEGLRQIARPLLIACDIAERAV